MSVCRSRGRPRLGGGSGNQYLEDPGCSSSAISEGWAGGNARAESAATARITRFSTAVHKAHRGGAARRERSKKRYVFATFAKLSFGDGA
jgi:hypothetical protein